MKRIWFVKISKEQYEKLPDDLKKHFEEVRVSGNAHPT